MEPVLVIAPDVTFLLKIQNHGKKFRITDQIDGICPACSSGITTIWYSINICSLAWNQQQKSTPYH
jgi:hypothetical protein